MQRFKVTGNLEKFPRLNKALGSGIGLVRSPRGEGARRQVGPPLFFLSASGPCCLSRLPSSPSEFDFTCKYFFFSGFFSKASSRVLVLCFGKSCCRVWWFLYLFFLINVFFLSSGEVTRPQPSRAMATSHDHAMKVIYPLIICARVITCGTSYFGKKYT
jgi:hypothetical protein